jgi:putative peptidoglycan lipid II flippase
MAKKGSSPAKSDTKGTADSNSQLTRFAAIFAGGTLISRVLGLLRDMVLGAVIPSAALGSFLFAFRFPNMLRDMLGEGATNAAFVPVFSESHEQDDKKAFRELVSACLSFMLIVFGVLTVLGVLLMPMLPRLLTALQPLTHATLPDAAVMDETVRLMQWTFPYLLLIGLAVFASAPLYTMRHYGTPSWSPVLLNVSLIACCLLLHRYFANPAWALVTGVWLGGLAQLIVMFAAMKKHSGVLWPNFKLRHPGIQKVFWLLGPVILGQATGEVNKLVDSFFAYSIGEEVVVALFYANRLIQLPLSIFGMAVAVAILPAISRASVRKDNAEIRQTLMFGLRQSAFLVLPAMVGLILLREPIIRLLFEHGQFGPDATARAATALLFYGFGLLSFAWVKVTVQGFYAAQDTKTPVIIASASMALNILLNCVLVGPLGFIGLALATTLSFTVNFVFLYMLLCNRYGRLWDAAFLGGLFRVALAVFFMGILTYGVHFQVERIMGHATLAGRALNVVLPLAAAVGLYGILCKALNIPEYHQLWEAIRQRRAR